VEFILGSQGACQRMVKKHLIHALTHQWRLEGWQEWLSDWPGEGQEKYVWLIRLMFCLLQGYGEEKCRLWQQKTLM